MHGGLIQDWRLSSGSARNMLGSRLTWKRPGECDSLLRADGGGETEREREGVQVAVTAISLS